MNTSRHKLILYGLAFIILLAGCKRERYGCTDPRAGNYDVSAEIDDGTCNYQSDFYYGECSSSADGNLIINNHTGEVLYLYKNYNEASTDAFVTCIPDDTSDFMVYIPNNELSVCLLQIWKAETVEDMNEPDLSKVHRQWSVALSNTTLSSERANWLITGSDNVSGTGTLFFTYPDEDETGHPVIYQVDIMLNSKTGARLASLRPGITGKKVSVDYGVHYLFQHYWYSDPNSTSGAISDIGWAETKEVVVNEFHKEVIIDIPVFSSNVGKYGFITVFNRNNHVVNLYANDRLIEDICLVEGSPQGLSSIPANSSTTFKVPADMYTVHSKTLDGALLNQFNNISVVSDEEVKLETGLSYKTIQLVNNTNLVLGLFTIEEEYLGLKTEATKTSPIFTIPAKYDTLLVMDFSRTMCKGISSQTLVTIDKLDEYLHNRVVMETIWPLNEGIYESPEIGDNTETTMVASMSCTESVVLTFEYNVSSEEDYDMFSFIANGVSEVVNESGETGWVSFSKAFAPGTYPLIWKYSKDQTREEGRDNVQIRNINVN